MLAKCFDEEQTKWAPQHPFVLMASRSLVYESTGYTPFAEELAMNIIYQLIPCSCSPVSRTRQIKQLVVAETEHLRKSA